MILSIILISAIILFLLIFVLSSIFFLKRTYKTVSELNTKKQDLSNSLKKLQVTYNELSQKNTNIVSLNEELARQKDSLNNIIKITTDKYNELLNKTNELNNTYNNLKSNKEQEILQQLEDFKKHNHNLINQEIEEYKIKWEEDKQKLEKIITDFKSQEASIIKLKKEKEEEKESESFYSLKLKDLDLSDISLLKTIRTSLNHVEILDKLIYKTYYEKPYTDLVGRVIGKNKITGIYKITNKRNGKIYIGQAVDIAERWRQHLKRALNAEPRTNNKLYPAMEEDGPENFDWNVVEECSKEELTEKEKKWIQFFESQSYGYNIKG